MDKMWGTSVVKLRAENAKRGQLFADGNYAMFIHWGLYSQLANKVNGKTYYGIGEWIMNKNMANIPVAEYKSLAKTFNPVKFDAMKIAQVAKDAGMKYIIITSKHHDGFAMYHSKANAFNIVDATPFKRDPMKDLATACRKLGLGFGFYYSHNQDWTFPGGGNGPKTDEQGNPATFDDYFEKKCLPQIKEITSQYGPIELVWFDTPGRMPKKYVEELISVVRKNQPNALISGRAGHGLGDYRTLGDMEIPRQNVAGLWESVDTTNDSWAYAWYDEYWKTPKEILRRLISCVGRGGTYMLNIGPRGDGSVPERATRSLRHAGEWIRRYPQVVYAADASPWKHALPWGDVTVKDNKLFLSVFEWPTSGKLYLPGLRSKIISAQLLGDKQTTAITHQQSNGWTIFQLPPVAPEKLASVIEVSLDGHPNVDPTLGIDPSIKTDVLAELAQVKGAKLAQKHWMEKFGEWKCVHRVHHWTPGSKATWEVDVIIPGDYNVSLTYSGEGRLVWGVDIKGGEHIQNQQNSSHNYQTFPIGWLNFPKPGRYHVSVSCLKGNTEAASLKAIQFTPIP
ncbi:MAG: alpha-L-fucosidase [Verrucomicrobiae bacterium]|nr:alpha-L-fucosidase [Verrucomicrobiae bacterium]NNJ42231.1 alpha-L-fucosidase [Akkermansiaceae bacterium]